MKGILAILGCSWGVLTAHADWHQFRGLHGSGFAEGEVLPTALGEESILWKKELPGRGLSSPIIVGDRVFITASSGHDQTELHVLCFHAETGEKLWERKFWATGRTMAHEKTSVAAPSPASDGKRIFALFSSNDLFCLDLNGELLWLRGLTIDYPNASNSLGMTSSLLVSGETLITQVESDSESFTAGIDVTSGMNRWRLTRPKVANWTSPIALQSVYGGPEVVALQSSQGVSGVDPETGKLLWEYKEGASTIASSTSQGSLILVPSHGLTALDTSEIVDGAPQQRWRGSQLRPDTASPVVLNKTLYVINGAGVLAAAEIETGERLWRIRLEGPFSASPLVSNDHMYVFNEAGLGQVVALTGDEGKVVSTVDLAEVILSTPAISDGALWVRSDRHLWRIGNSVAAQD